MKHKFLLILLLTTATLTACTTIISEPVLQTAVSEVIMTSSAGAAPTPQKTQPAAQAPSSSDEELEALQGQLEAANLALTERAAQIEALWGQLQQVQLRLTPTITPTPTVTPTPTNTLPPATPSLPSDQKYVVAIDKAPLWYFKEKNANGHPIMIKTSPVVRYEAGETFVVYTGITKADGGTYYYQVVGPKGAGYYVSVDDVKDQ